MAKAEREDCRLCGAVGDLKRSHIYPEFLYKPSYDNIHRATRVDIDTMKNSFLQKGLRERLLCGACEGHLSKTEGIFKTDWYDNGRLPEEIGDEFLKLSGLDYVQFKLFHLSIRGVVLSQVLKSSTASAWDRMRRKLVNWFEGGQRVPRVGTDFGVAF